ncbi:hypothetical protein K6U06_01565 [Acidiferrimicrobium sp. IK]|uniref:hypothetical protein n=1 Tax=Acidiferrimicrobium sp. IK TaxID=2871700 RepID=UPI0021CB5B1E|nr:hypothetical protein [Acidiferrimicrobium sp. IK]MCU4183032.1 hypothetical protein [Acidiferrimicrobium sp. IK]
MLVIDAAKVIGSRPTGWWRDRPGAARLFTQRVRGAVTAGLVDQPVTIVLEGRARLGVAEGDEEGVAVVHAPAAGDDTIAALAEANPGVVVVTADRELAARVRAARAEVAGPSWPDRAGCSIASTGGEVGPNLGRVARPRVPSPETSDAVDGEVGACSGGELADVAGVRGDHRVVVAEGTLDRGHINDFIVRVPSGQGADCSGLGLGEILDVTALQQPGQLRLWNLASFGEHSGRPRWRIGEEGPVQHLVIGP